MEEEPTTPLRDDSREPAASWHVGLWVAQIMLAVVFGMAGFAKVSSPIPELQAQLDWADDVPIWLVRFIGASELLGAIVDGDGARADQLAVAHVDHFEQAIRPAV